MMTKQSRVWLVLFALLVAVPAGAQVTDCTDEPNGEPCVDTDGDICTVAACSSEVCNQQFGELPAGTPCTDTDGNSCTIARCRVNDSECNQGSAREQEGTACTLNGVAGVCGAVQDGSPCLIINNQNAPTMSGIGTAGLTMMLMAVGLRRMRRRTQA